VEKSKIGGGVGKMAGALNPIGWWQDWKNGGALAGTVDKQPPPVLNVQDNSSLETKPVLTIDANSFSPQVGTINTANARGSALTRPDDQIGFNEMMIRTGGAMMGGAQQGGLSAYSAATDAYGNIQDANRANALDRYNTEMKAQTALDKMNAKSARTQPADPNAGVAVNDEIERALEIVIDDQKDTWMPFENLNNATGIVGAMTKGIPTTNAYRLDSFLNMIKANIGFDKLADMRAKSPTGGALGQVSNLEIGLLQAVWADLRQGNRPEDLEYNLRKLQYHYNTVIHGDPKTGALNHNYKMPTRGGSSSESGLSAKDEAARIRLNTLLDNN